MNLWLHNQYLQLRISNNLLRINLQGAALLDAQGVADLLGNHDTAKAVHPAHDACCFHVHLSFLFNVERWYYLQEKAKYAKKMPLFHVKQRHLMFGSLRPRRISIRRADHSDRSGSFTRLLSSKVFQARIVSGDSPLSTYRPGLRQQQLHQRRDRACQRPGSQWSARRRPRRRR